MAQCKMKYTLNDRAFMDKILDAFCIKKTKKTWILRGVTGEVDLGKSSIPKRAVEFLEKEGLHPRFEPVTRYKGLKKICGIDVEIKAKNPSSFVADGIIITVVYSGETEQDCRDDQAVKEDKLVKYATSKGIPMTRICAEESLRCVYKFGNGNSQTCATV